MERDLLVAELILLSDQLSLLVLEACDVVGRLRDLSGEAEVEEDGDQDGAGPEVGMAERVQPQPFDCGCARHLHEAARAPPPPWGGGMRRACCAQAASSQYSGRYQDVCLIRFLDVCCGGCWLKPLSPNLPEGEREQLLLPSGLAPGGRRGWPATRTCGVRSSLRPEAGQSALAGWTRPPLRKAALVDG